MKKILIYTFILLVGLTILPTLTTENKIYRNYFKSIKKTTISKIEIVSPRLIIPKINIDTQMVSIWITSKWKLDSPKDISDIWLYKLWVIPGEIWNAIIVGHYGFINWKWAIFNNLNKLIIWDKIYYLNKNGLTITFVVTKTKIYKNNELSSEIYNSNDNKSHLNIITCQWIWDKINKTYSDRLVIFADKM